MTEIINTFLEMTGSLATGITLGITLITSASLLIVNLARFFQAKKFGLPLKIINQASLPDSLDLWIVVISSFGFGRFLPGYLADSDMNIFLAFTAIFISCFASLLLLRSKANNFRLFWGKRNVIEFNTGGGSRWSIIVSFLVAGIFIYLGYAHRTWVTDYTFDGHSLLYVLFRIASVLLRLYEIYISTLFIVCIIAKLYGDKETMIVEMNNQNYLLAVRHSSLSWVLMPCTVENEEKVIAYTRGKFIIRDMSTLDEKAHVTCCEQFALKILYANDKEN